MTKDNKEGKMRGRERKKEGQIEAQLKLFTAVQGKIRMELLSFKKVI